MKKIILFTLIMLMAISVFSIVCFAEEATDSGSLDAAFGSLKEAFSSLEIDWESLKAYAMENKDDIVAVVLVIVLAIMKGIVNKIVKKVGPEVAKQTRDIAELAVNMVDHENQVAKDNKEWRELANGILEKMQEKLDNAEERDKLLARSTLALEKSDARYAAMTRILAEAFMAQATTSYDALMSAKLTDIRKEEIEANYLNQKKAYAMICELCAFDIEEKEETALVEVKEVAANEEALVA